MTSGHVFVLRADLLNLNADAWMLPTDRRLSIRDLWIGDDVELQARAQNAKPRAFGADGALAFAIPPRSADDPLAVATAVPSDNRWTPTAVRDRVDAFARVALGARPTTAPGRPRPLLAVPFLGSRGGSATDLGGQVASLLAACRETADALGADIAVVLRDEAAYTLAQAQRRADPARWWPELDSPLQRESARLGDIARSGRMVPFLGAGVSVSAGAPSWASLLDELLAPLDLTDNEHEGLAKLGALDKASLIEALYCEQDVRPGFRERIASAVGRPRYGIAPALLAAIPSDGAITLNYDDLFENACRDAGAPRAVIPESASPDGRWLLKLHGTVNDPKTIVLTRDDYLGFNASREALSSLVKAHLMTHHLLFVGFGLSDDHFYEIVHDVRRAVPRGAAAMGTALMLFADGLQRRAWDGKLSILPMTHDGAAPADFPAAGRRLEVFLDAMMAHATQEHRYLLADGYGEALTAEDAALRRDLFALVAKHKADGGPAWEQLRKALEGFGLPRATPSDEEERPRFLTVRSQNVTDVDRTKSVLRIPAASKHAFPPEPSTIRMNIGGVERDVAWNPRAADHRSGTLGVGVDVMRNLRARSAPVWLRLVDGVYHVLEDV